MSEENIHVDTLVTEDMDKGELYDYAKYLEYRKEELLNINSSLQQKVEQLENIRKEAIKWVKLMGKYENGSCTRNFRLMSADFNYLLNILNKGDNK